MKRVDHPDVRFPVPADVLLAVDVNRAGAVGQAEPSVHYLP